MILSSLYLNWRSFFSVALFQLHYSGLTNNLAEQQLRPLVVMRKMSGGSKTLDGAKVHMVIMSVFQSIKLRGDPIVETLKSNIFSNCFAA